MVTLNETITPQPEQSQPAQAAQADPQAPTSGNVTGGVPGIAQPQVQGPTPTTNAQAVNQVASQPVSQAQLHTGWFHGMMQRMNQGDQQVVRDRNGNPVAGPDGKPQMQPMTSKQMGRSILAGVLSAMAATEAHQPYRNGNGVWVNPSNEAVAAGQQAFQAGRPRAQQQQATDDLARQRTQQYATYESNVKTFKLAHEVAQMKMDDAQKAVAPYSAGYEAGEAGDIEGYNSETGDLTEQEAKDQFQKMDTTKNMMVPNGKVVPALGPDGQPNGRFEVHYMILPGQDGKIPITAKMIADHNLKGVKEGTMMPIAQWSKLVRGTSAQHVIGSTVNDLAAKLGLKGDDGNPIQIDYNKFIKASKATPDQIEQLGHLSHDRDNPVDFVKDLKAIDTTGNIRQALEDQGVKIDAKAWAAEQAKQLASDKNLEARQNKQEDLKTGVLNDALAEDVLATFKATPDHGGISQARYDAASLFVNDKSNRKVDEGTRIARAKALEDAGGIDAMQQTANDIVSGGSIGTLRDYTSMRGTQKQMLNNAIQAQARAMGRDPQLYSPGALESRAKMWTDYTEGKTNGNIGSFDTFLRHAQDGIDGIEQMKKTSSGIRGIPLANRPLNWLAKNATGDPGYIAYSTKFIPIAKEFESFLNSGRAEHTEDIAAMAAALNDTTRSPSQNEETIRTLAGSADKRLAALADRYQKNMLQTYPDILSSDAVNTLHKLGYSDPDTVRVMRDFKPNYDPRHVAPAGSQQAPPPPPGFN